MSRCLLHFVAIFSFKVPVSLGLRCLVFGRLAGIWSYGSLCCSLCLPALVVALWLGLAFWGWVVWGGACLGACLLAGLLAGLLVSQGFHQLATLPTVLKLTRCQSRGWWCHEHQMVLLTAEVGLLSI